MMSIERGKSDVEISMLNPKRFSIAEFAKKKDSSSSARLKKFLRRRIFILSWLPDYDRSKAVRDLIAGVTLGLTMVPQSLAYANLANVPAQYGLYSAFMGSLIYVVLGTVREVSIGPTSLMSILTVSYTFEKPVEYVIIMTFVCGCVEFLMGVFKLGFIVDFISAPVVSSFSTSTSLIIIVAQLKNLLGLKFSAKDLPTITLKLVKNIGGIRLGDAFLGAFAIVFLLILKNIKDIKLPDRPSTPFVKRLLFYLSISRNAMIVLITSFFAYQISIHYEEVPFRLSEKVEPGMPSFQLPAFSANIDNRTVGFVEICSDIGSGLILLPLVSILANVAIAKSFTSGKIVDASQEMIALGLANFFGSFFKSIPTCGAFTRSAVSNASGVASPLSGIYSAVMALLALTLLTPYFNYIPKTTLAAILICAVLSLIDFAIAKHLWRTNKIDFVSWLGCIIVCVGAGIEIGLLFGVALSTLHILFKAARPATSVCVEQVKGQECIHLMPASGLDFPGVDFLRDQINRSMVLTDFKLPVVVDCSRISTLDYTSVKGIDALTKDLRKHNQTVTLVNLDEKLERLLSSMSK